MKMPQGCMICTDVAARGLDFPAVDWVVQLDAPEDVDMYIHRVGRAARYDSAGSSLIMVLPNEEKGIIKHLEKRKIPITKINPRKGKVMSISDQLQHFCFQDPEIKYLGQKSFISYVRSIYLKRNAFKNEENAEGSDDENAVFDVLKLPFQQYAESLGLPNVPKISFIDKLVADEKRKQWQKQQQESTKRDKIKFIGEEQSDEEDKGKNNGVNSKVNKMINRKNTNVFTEHYQKLVDRNDDTSNDDDDSDGDFLVLKPKSKRNGDGGTSETSDGSDSSDSSSDNDSASDSDDSSGDEELIKKSAQGQEADNIKDESLFKVLTVNPRTQMPVVVPNIPANEMTKKQIRKAKQKIIKNTTNNKFVFDEHGNAVPVYQLETESSFYSNNDVNSKIKDFTTSQISEMAAIDQHDKLVDHEKRKLKRIEKKARSKMQNGAENATETHVTIGHGSEDEYSDNDSDSGSYSEDDNSDQSDASAQEYSTPVAGTKRSSDYVNNTSKKTKQLDLQDQESLALQLLND
ncbi:ATP-dependent RNA helicase DBP4 [Zancudomyces culisetae]|uniref:ATP-dependent RNA helicase n=1 Tax=Zancudomyces culisetae TaxID=1213189 RepID=A0A1R1PKB7_ZANCU|nr:ATP-dependent RNA helicase DBP4 [Zancudomyces culisetae]|eukprot:OMH81363.1 ATP-dependent RNA helicase DBP4 [Zancudomyces culisetae]